MPDPSDLTRITDLARTLGDRPHPHDEDQATAQAQARVNAALLSSHKARRDRYAARIYEYWNPGSEWADAHRDDRIAYGADADIAMAAADAEAGIPVPSPVRADIYVEVADRLALFAATPQGKAATAGQLADKVRAWAGQPTPPAQTAPRDLPLHEEDEEPLL
ncbi:hypothetical protein [Streptomyces antibioticus]|uniref:hypothetical protein n=1 Tax=Streptomyces antibioticus TaxID=1890 RepID=UPI0036F75C97